MLIHVSQYCILATDQTSDSSSVRAGSPARDRSFRHQQGRNVGTLQLSGGGRLEFLDQGSGPAMVFLHGWSLGKEAFGKQRRELCNRYRVVIPDMRGHGNSEKFLEGDGIDTLAGDLERLLVALDLEEVVLVGWSMGALVAWQIATGPQS